MVGSCLAAHILGFSVFCLSFQVLHNEDFEINVLFEPLTLNTQSCCFTVLFLRTHSLLAPPPLLRLASFASPTATQPSSRRNEWRDCLRNGQWSHSTSSLCCHNTLHFHHRQHSESSSSSTKIGCDKCMWLLRACAHDPWSQVMLVKEWSKEVRLRAEEDAQCLWSGTPRTSEMDQGRSCPTGLGDRLRRSSSTRNGEHTLVVWRKRCLRCTQSKCFVSQAIQKATMTNGCHVWKSSDSRARAPSRSLTARGKGEHAALGWKGFFAKVKDLSSSLISRLKTKASSRKIHSNEACNVTSRTLWR